MPTLDETRVPAHALEEIKAAKGARKGELTRWWESWASVGDAKAAEREAFSALVDAQAGYAACRAALAAKQTGSLPPEACACGKHHTAMVKAQKAREKALTVIERAIDTHKAGG